MKTRSCKNCQKEFIPKTKMQRHCSRYCSCFYAREQYAIRNGRTLPSRASRNKQCKVCSQPFTATRVTQKYCSKKCANRIKARNNYRRIQSDPKKLAHRRQLLEKYKEKARQQRKANRKPIEKICGYCNKKFEAWRSTRLYCSHQCRYESWYNKIKADPERWKEYLQSIYASKKRLHKEFLTLMGIVKKDRNKCQFCGDTFQSRAHNQKYCSRQCKYYMSRKRQRDEQWKAA